MIRIVEEAWIIVDKKELWIAKGTPRNRYLIPIDKKDGKRYLTYTTKKKAEGAFSGGNGFYNQHDVISLYGLDPYGRENLEKCLKAVKVRITLSQVDEAYEELERVMNGGLKPKG